MTRTWPIPPVERTFHAIGDIQGALLPRLDAMRADLDLPTVPQVAHRVTLGDCTANGSPSDDTYFHAFWNQLTGTGKHAVVGNHDTVGPRSPQAAATALGMPSKDYVVDMGYAVLIVIGPDVTTGLLIYRTPTMDWVKDQLETYSDRVCIIAAHAPLQNTVLTSGLSYGSDMYLWCAMGEGAAMDAIYTDVDLRAVIADYPNMKAWVSGHTHSFPNARDIVKAETIGGHTVAAINTGSILPSGYLQSPFTPVASPFITVYDDRIETRWRDHTVHQWISTGTYSERVATVNF